MSKNPDPNPRAVAGNNRSGLDSETGKHLLSFIERVERLDEDAKAIAEDRKDVLSEAKGTGFDVKAIRAIIALRKQDRDARREMNEILQLYAQAIGMGDIFG